MADTENSLINTAGIPEIEQEVEVFGMTQTAVDKTLTIEDCAADAKAVGDRFGNVEADISDLTQDISDLTQDISDLTQDIGTIQENFQTLDTEVDQKINNPSGVPEGKFLQTDAEGNPTWGDAASPSAVAGAVSEWMNENIPSGQTIAIDQSFTISGAAADAKKTGDRLTNLEGVAQTATAQEVKSYLGIA